MGAPRLTAAARLTLTHLALVALSSALVLALVYWSARQLIDAETLTVVDAEMMRIVDDYNADGLFGAAEAINRRLGERGAADGVYLLMSPRDRPMAGNLGRWPPEARTARVGAGVSAEFELERTDTGERAAIRARAIQLPNGARLLVGRDARTQRDFDAALVRAFLLGLGGAAALALATGWLLSRLTLRRLNEATRAARAILAGDLASRVPVHGRDDEFDRLAGVLNEMLSMLEAQVSELRLATDSLAHDLRSPLTRLKHHLEAAERAPDAAAARERLVRAGVEIDGALATLSGLLAIARTEAGVGRDQLEPLDLAALAREIVELYAPVAEDSGRRLTLDAAGAAEILGHPALLSQALSNLLENALRYGPSGEAIEVRVTTDAAQVALSVGDRGPGIPEAERARVLKRFETLDAARGRVRAADGAAAQGGAGLGLALVAAVARLHGGTVTLSECAPRDEASSPDGETSTSPGLLVELRFAAAS